MANERTGKKEVIILNKPFLGGWLNKEGRIGHEIIDFFLADNEQYYVYNNPWGVCPKDIWVGDSDENDYGLKKKSVEQYIAKYMVLTSDAHASVDESDSEADSAEKKSAPKTFNILYVIELKAKMHRFNTGRSSNIGLKKGQEEVGSLIEKHGIKYNGKPLNEIYGEDDSLYLTFEATVIYKVKEGEILSFTPEQYNFQRNKGYIKSDEHKKDYSALLEIITDGIKNHTLEKLDLQPLKPQNGETYHVEKTFLDLIGYTDSEQAFTNMLQALLKNSAVFKKFCEEFKDGEADFAEEATFMVEREKKVEGGRMDICGDSEQQRVIIENKIYSGLNGLDVKAHTSQLSTYYHKWGTVGERKAPLCFITVPDYRKAEIEAEIKKFDPSMKDKYKIITYREIADFIEKNKTLFEGDRLIPMLIDQIINAFRKWSYKDRAELYTNMFLGATKGGNNT